MNERFIDFMYKVYISYNAVDKREEIINILKDQIYGIPVYTRVPETYVYNDDLTHLSRFKNRMRNVFIGLNND
jgi:hypothetical protein